MKKIVTNINTEPRVGFYPSDHALQKNKENIGNIKEELIDPLANKKGPHISIPNKQQ